MGNNKSIKKITDSLEFFESADLAELNSLLYNDDVTIEDLKLACKRAMRRQRDSKYGVRAYNSLNKKFAVQYMVEWGIITPTEARILEVNCINNLYDLFTKSNIPLKRIKSPVPIGSYLNNRGKVCLEVSYDIDKKLRGSADQGYDIGAWEFDGQLYDNDLGILSFDIMTRTMVTNIGWCDWSYIIDNVSIELTFIGAILIWTSVTLIDKYLGYHDIFKKFILYFGISIVPIFFLEVFLINKGMRVYNEATLNNFSGLTIEALNMPLEIFFGSAFYLLIILPFITYIIFLVNQKK